MNFKEIRLVGFKSFADKTSIKFDDGVTCIVGPNGCGKSNVADAVRWVLGEQSAKALRGGNMQDVIFNGSDTRRQLSYCEVTLVFDNAQRIFDIEYAEVAMTRRLYRSGESEYLLNMQPCRLRDIVALLHGVGIGKEGYSIIGQGKVAQIMNSKPQERRAIFEEATGVIKFKSDKGEIERKIENSQSNLAVYIQRMDEAEKQLHPLEKQAEAARKYREYSENLKYEEVNAYLAKSDTYEQETARQREIIDRAEKEIVTLQARAETVDRETEESRESIAHDDSRLRDLNVQLRTYEVGIERKRGEAGVMSERIRSYRHQLDQIERDLTSARLRIEEVDAASANSRKKLEDYTRRSDEIDAECADVQTKLAEADFRVTAYEQITAEKRASELSNVESLADIRANVGSLSAKRDATQDHIAEVQDNIKKAEVHRMEYERQIAECRKEKAAVEEFLNGKAKREEELLAEIADLTRSQQKMTEEINDCNNAIFTLNNNLELYISLKNRFDGYRDSVRRLQLDAKKNPDLSKRIIGAIADIVTTEKKYEVAIETAFGQAMQNLVVEKAEDGRWLIEYLKRTGGGIVTFLPVESMRTRPDSREAQLALRETGALGLATELVKFNSYYDNVIRNLLGNTLVCDTIANATNISRKYQRAFRIVTLDGDTIATSGSMTGGSRRKDSGNLLANERQIKECEEGINRKKATLEKLKRALSGCVEELEEARAEYEAFRVKVQEETANFAVLGQKELSLAGLIADAQADFDEYNTLLQRLTRTISDIEGEVLSSAQSEELIRKIREEAALEAKDRSIQIEKLKADRDALAEQLHALRVDKAQVSSGKTSEEENGKRYADERAVLVKNIEDNRELERVAESKIRALEEEEEKVALTEEEQQAVAALRADLQSVEQHKETLSIRQQELGEEARSLAARLAALTEEQTKANREIDRATIYLDNMKQRLQESYGLTYESALALRDPAYDAAQAETRINSLRHKIAALGPVNQRAVEDYEELLARYTEMQTQKQDLEKGIDDLTKILNDLREKIQKQFDDGFNEINANFGQIFKELFGGGKAYMQLDYEEGVDPLEAGVEIVACPPGKKLAKISLLSGGEQAFTAIAILFAILKSHPMPFCILDEIEAALDEANVDRFAKYLKKFSHETQFIVITHRKPTMAEADTLFGVTMEEKGVSKIVSVKLSEVETRLGGDTVIT